MKKFILYSFLLLWGTSTIAQQYTTHSFGYMGGQSKVQLNNQTNVQINYNGGDVIATDRFKSILPDQAQALVGFPAMVSYFPDVLDKDLFISKGYFSDYVQLKWNVLSQLDKITRIKIFRKPLGFNGDSLLISTISPDNFSYRDEFAEKGVLYKYTLFAEGIADDLRIPFINTIEGVGFAFPFGTAAGRVTFEGGTAVEGVQVLAETDGNLSGKSLFLNGSDAYLSIPHGISDDELAIESGFSLQLWARFNGSGKGTLFSKGGQYELSYEPGTLSFTVGDISLNMAYDHPVDTFFHITAVHDPSNGLALYVQKNDFELLAATESTLPTLNADQSSVIFGRDYLQANYFSGYIDELRLWNIPLSEEEAKSNFSRYLSGSDDGLAGYWRLNSGVSDEFYDFSRDGFEFFENHGKVWRGEWSETVPTKTQLAYRGVTDASGNYVVRGFPYETDGSQYTFTPVFDVHSFEPNQQLRFVGDGSSIFNGLDFQDVSSFPVSGTIRYRNSAFTVEGISILIDGKAAIDQDGQLILTDNQGQFTVDVPIGEHSIRLSKNGHVFEDEGRFPPATQDNEFPTYNYQKPLAGLEFIDNTVVKFVGKVVGGPIEAEKPRGFGLSVNNIGNAQITLTTEKGLDISASAGDSTELYNERDIASSAVFNKQRVTLYPNEETGEFVAYLLPEKHVVENVTAGSYTFGDEHKVTLNLETFFEQTESYDEVVMALLPDGSQVPGYDAFDSADYDYFKSEEVLDTTYITAGQNFIFEKDKDFILRVKPEIAVVNEAGNGVFGERTYQYEDEIRENEIVLVDENDNYTFGNPVFFQQSRYRMFISVFEEYVNIDLPTNDPKRTTRVPVKDGKIEIVNDFGINTDVETLELNDSGKATYTFGAGFPELNKNITDPQLSFTRPLSLIAVTGANANIRTAWRENDEFRAIVFGGVAQGNDFVTTGPNQIITILRDPPGSGSRAFLEKGRTIKNNVSWGTQLSTSISAKATVKLGPETTVWTGVGAGTIVTNKVKNNVQLGLELSSSFSANGSTANTITTTKSWSTSSAPGFVSDPGDVFVGNSTNIVYGAALSLQPIPVTDIECANGDCDGIQNGDFKLGPRVGLRLNPEFGTMFIYTQSHIENVLIPNLKEIRNSLLTAPNPDVVATDEVINLSLVAADDDRFGSANYDVSIWSDNANAGIGVGPSYEILIPVGMNPDLVSDTVGYYNKQIEGWLRVLSENERAKVEAQLAENISFDGGTSFASSRTVESSSSYSFNFNVGIKASLARTTGVQVLGIGAEVNMSRSISLGANVGGGFSESNSTTYGYSLADGSISGGTADYYSIDVKTPEDGFGPVFVTRAGVTSCPYEGESVTQYFEPGEHILNFATVQVEKPEITIVNPEVPNVPSNRAAEILLELKNNSESDTDIFYNLKVNDQSNFNGAILSIDGSVLTGDGRGILVPAGTTVSKILKVNKGSDDINDYEDIILTLSSQCDSKIKDSQSFSVYFQPGCSDINLVAPVDLWVVNTNTVPEEIQNIVFDDYDLQNEQFEYVKFQYKAVSSSQWLTNMIFYNPRLVTQQEYDLLDEPKAWISETGSTSYPWDMSDLPDRRFDIRVVSVCEIAPGETAETPSLTHTGIKDTKRPLVFGAPQPADGVLSANDEIKLQFDETIEAGLLTPFNFSVQGVLNSAEIRHSASVNFDGDNDYVKIEDGLNLANRSFTIEFWVNRRNFAKEQVLFSKGRSASDALEFGFAADNRFFVNAGGQRTTSILPYPDEQWSHYAVVYTAQDDELTVHKNGQPVIAQATVAGDFSGEGAITLGKSQFTAGNELDGNMHELRIWTQTKSQGDVFAKMNASLTGSEVGLVGYWPMDEAIGNKAFDKARFRHALLFAEWEVSPKGNAYAFDGVDDLLTLNTGSTVVITDEMDYTIEFWFKGGTQANTTMFSSGRGDGLDEFNDPANSLSIGFDEGGELYYLHNGTKLSAAGEYLDENWHHFVFTLSRQSNANLFVDGQQKATMVASNFGGLSGASMWIGARGYKTSSVITTYDQYFEGNIDEFRVWNMGKKSDQINLDINSRLYGDEIGLVGYYPFEYYETINGIQIMNSTLDDQWVNPHGANAGASIPSGGAGFSDDTPNIKDARPVEKIDFDWVVNDDQIIITPASIFAPLIEQTTLEITVREIQDLYENRLASPVSWTAFVDRNQLKWEDDQVIAQKQVYEPFSFTMDVFNLGGTEESFTIDNLPQWLTASPASGVLAPVSSQTITFTVDEGLNTGYYLEDIYLSSDFGFDEKLILDLQVFSPAPDWDTDPFGFQYSMNFIAQLEVENIISTDINDRVAAFVNGEIRGDANLIYLEAFDLYTVYLDIYSNVESGESIELRVWDASAGVEYRQALPQISFVANEVQGGPADPELIIAGNTNVQDVSLRTGWNWVSFNLSSSTLSDIDALMSAIDAQTGDQIKGQNNVDVYTDEIGWLGSISDNGGLKDGTMYLFKLANAGNIELIGNPIPSSTEIAISEGWNWVGFTPRFNMSLNEAFAFFNPSHGDVIKSQFAFSIYQENIGWIGSLNNLEPGKGYLFSSQSAGTVRFPESTFLSGRMAYEPNLITQFDELDRFKYPNNMSVIATIEGLEDGYTLLARHGNEVRGVIEPIMVGDGDPLYFITIYGNLNAEEISFEAFDPSTGDTFSLSGRVSFNQEQHLGSMASPVSLQLGDGLEPVLDVAVYPNPFTDELRIELPKTYDILPEMTLINLTGQTVGHLQVIAEDNMWSAVVRSNSLGLQSGLYIIRVMVGQQYYDYKIIKK